MKRLVVVGVGLLLAPLAWSAGALESHQEGAFLASISDTWQGLFAEGDAPVKRGRDLTGLAMVPREHQRGVGHTVTLDELDSRVSDRVFERRVAQQAANMLMRERLKPFVSEGLADDVLEYERSPNASRLQRLYAPPDPTTEGIRCGLTIVEGVTVGSSLDD